MKKKIIGIVIIAVVVIVVGMMVGVLMMNQEEKSVITSAELERIVNISELSTAEFVYNGVAEAINAEDPSKVDCYISYHANVKVGIQMDAVEFRIDDETMTVTPILPPIEVTVATLDETEISYIPKNPDLALSDIITLCREDAINEARNTNKLYETAEENLKSVIEALLSPIMEDVGYSIVW